RGRARYPKRGTIGPIRVCGCPQNWVARAGQGTRYSRQRWVVSPERSFLPADGGAMNDARPLRVAIADDALLLREGIAKVLEGGGLEVVASVGTGDELLQVVRDVGIDAAVLDIRMPPTYRDEGITALETLRAG